MQSVQEERNTMQPVNFNDPQSCWDSESRQSPYSTVADPYEDDYCEHCDSEVDYSTSPDGVCGCD